jgi:hypothetical protein
MGVPEQLVLNLNQVARLSYFIETGTFYGNTAVWAANHFDNVITIEIDEEISKRAASRANNPKNINYLVGSSALMLSKVVSELNQPAFFWLDGHYSGPGTGGESNECPLMFELETAFSSHGSVIMIDDARCFLGPPCPPHNPSHWPRIDDIFQIIKQLAPDYITTIHDDVIISIPHNLSNILDDDWLKNYGSRFNVYQKKIGRRQKIIGTFKEILNIGQV